MMSPKSSGHQGALVLAHPAHSSTSRSTISLSTSTSTKVPIDSGKEEAEQAIPLPLILENITQTIRFPHDSMDEASFLGELVDTCNCGLSLDVTNLYINSVNYGFDPCHRYPAQNVSSSE